MAQIPALGSFNLEQLTNIFTMSGGTIRIYDVCGIGAVEQEAFDVKSSASNINVTGGTLEIMPVTGTVLADAGNYFISTTASLYNLLIDRVSSASVVQLKTSPLVVLNDLTIVLREILQPIILTFPLEGIFLCQAEPRIPQVLTQLFLMVPGSRYLRLTLRLRFL